VSEQYIDSIMHGATIKVKRESVYCAVRTESLNILILILVFKEVKHELIYMLQIRSLIIKKLR